MATLHKTYGINVDTNMKQLMKGDFIQYHQKLTPVITTLYDSRVTEFDIKDYIESGMRIIAFRITWISKEDRMELVSMVKKATQWCCQKYDIHDWPIALSVDIPNVCISTGFLKNNDPARLVRNSFIKITSDAKYYSTCDARRIFINDPYTLPTIVPGTVINLSFGKILLECIQIVDNKTIKCKVVKEGTLDNQEIVCLRGIKLLKPPLPKRDVDLIEFARDNKFDIITINSIRFPSTIEKIRALFKDTRDKPLIISTICEEEGLNNIDEIIEVSDGLILAREFLAATLTNANYLLRIQLQVSAKCKMIGKPFYISGNILEGSIEKGVLTASDMNDLITAVGQGAGFVLRVFKEARDTTTALNLMNEVFSKEGDNDSFASQEQLWRLPHSRNMIPVNAAVACVQACVLAAKAMGTTVIIVPTVSGKTVVQLSHWSDSFTIIAITSSRQVARKLLLHPGVVCLPYAKKRISKWEQEMIARIKYAASYAVRFHILQFGESFIVLRKHFATSGYCDRVGIWKVITEEESRRVQYMKTKATTRTVAVRSTIAFKYGD